MSKYGIQTPAKLKHIIQNEKLDPRAKLTIDSLGDRLEKALYFFVCKGQMCNLTETLKMMFPLTYDKEPELNILLLQV